MRVKREMILENLQEELKIKVKHFRNIENKLMIFKEDELNRIRIALDESNYHRKQQEEILSTSRIDQRVYSVDQSPTKKSLYNRIKSAPNFGGIQRSINPTTKYSFKSSCI
jgi:hypothetical protein